MKKIIAIILLLFFCKNIYCAETIVPAKTKNPPVIDGKLDDDIWKQTGIISKFRTFSPDFGKNGSSETKAFAAYDSENLYFAFYCYENEPEKIKASIAARDNIRTDDWVCINLDTFNDHQSLYAFYVNPLGIQMDSRFAAGVEDFNSDYIWQSAGSIQNDGYCVEICIPLRSIRYSEGEKVTMSLFFERYISRFNEHVSYPELDPAKGYAFMTQLVPIEYNGLIQNTLLEFLPAFTLSRKYSNDRGELKKNFDKGEISFTSKYGLTSDLILDATYNPDFSQIEADAGQVDVNLRYALYYPEKRSFFQEGSETYKIAATQTSVIDPVVSFLHTRTIMNPLAGIKLSGKLDKNNTLALMYTADRIPSDQTAYCGDYAHSPVLRFKHAFTQDSYLGFLFTDRNMENHFNRVYGVDGMFRVSSSGTVELNGFLSDTKSDFTQAGPSGNTFAARFVSDTRDLVADFTVKSISENFISESGYLSRNGIFFLNGLMRPKLYPDSKAVQRIDIDFFSGQTKDLLSGLWETNNYVSANVYMLGSMLGGIKYSYSTEIFNGEKFNTGGFYFTIGGLVSKKISFSVQYRHLNAIYYSADPYQGRTNRISASFTYQPDETVESFSSFVYSDFYKDSGSNLVYEYPILRERLTYQPNKYLFFRGIIEYNKYKRQIITDFLISFTYMPGTVFYLGYGSLYQRTEWDGINNRYSDSANFLELQRGFFMKMSYLWRL